MIYSFPYLGVIDPQEFALSLHHLSAPQRTQINHLKKTWEEVLIWMFSTWDNWGAPETSQNSLNIPSYAILGTIS